MSRALSVCALVFAACLLVLPAVAQESAKKAEVLKPVPSPSQVVLAQWNEIGRKLVAMAEDLPENKYDTNPIPIRGRLWLNSYMCQPPCITSLTWRKGKKCVMETIPAAIG